MNRRRFKDGAGRAVETGKQVGNAGGEGIVYEVLGNPAVVMKVYHQLPDSSTIEKLEWMIANPPSEVSTQGQTTALAWPQKLLYDNRRKAVGFTMPFVEAWDVGRICDKRLRPKLLTTSNRQFDWRDLHTIARNVAMIVSACHHAGYVIGDINHNNVRVRRDGTVVVIDTDSFQVPSTNNSSARVHHCTKTFPGYTPPELIGKNLNNPHQRDPSADLFSLSVLIFELLQDRANPFQGVLRSRTKGALDALDVETAIKLHKYPYDYERLASDYVPPNGAPVYGRLHPDIRKLFQQTFVEGMGLPDLRPNAEAWISALDTARGSIRECRQGHLYSGHAGGVCLERSVDQTSVCGSTASSKAPQPVPVSKVNIFDGSIVGVTPPGPTRIGVPGQARFRIGNVGAHGVPRNSRNASVGRVVVRPGAQPSRAATQSTPPIAKESNLFRNFVVFTTLIVLMLVARAALTSLNAVSDQEGLIAPTARSTEQSVKATVAPTVTPLATNEPVAISTETNGPAKVQTQDAQSTLDNGSVSSDTSEIVRTRRKSDGSSRPLRVVTPDSKSTNSGSEASDTDAESQNPIVDAGPSRIVYSWNDGEAWHISIFEPDHGTARDLISGFSKDPVPIFTPNGSMLIFVEHPGDGGDTLIHTFELESNQIAGTYSLSTPILVDRISLTTDGAGLLLSVSDGSGPHVLQFSFGGRELLPFLPVSSLDFAMAPTGDSAYVVYENSEPKIVLGDEQGNATVYMAPGLYCQRLPVFSPDGANMAFLYGTCEGRVRRIAVWDGSSLVTLSNPNLRQWDPSVSIAWSPFQYVLAVAGCEEEACLITFVSIHGDSTVQILTQNIDASAVQIGSIDWSLVTVEDSQ